MTKTNAQSFFEDPKLVAAKHAILSCLKEHQSKITGIRPPQKELQSSYEKTIKQFEDDRGGSLFFPYLGSGLGNGPFVELADGSIKYDFIIGIGVHFFGHSHLKVIEASLDGALADTVMQGNLQQNTDSAKLVRMLIEIANKNGAKFEHCFLTTAGAMAGENAFKMAFQKREPAKRVLCFENCFMGRTLLMSNTTDNPKYREGLPKVVDVDYIPFFDENDPKGSTERALSTLKNLLAEHKDEYAAMSFELVLGEGGFYPGQKDFFISLMKELKKHKVAVLVDEVQSFARTTEPFAFQHFGLDEYVDIVWIGKASQACATLFRNDFKPKPGLLSQTYTASSSAIQASLVILEELMKKDYYGETGKISNIQNSFRTGLEELNEKYPQLIKGPYGVGAMVAFTPFNGELEQTKALVKKLFDNGVMSFFCGKSPVRVRFLIPALAVNENHIKDVLDILEKSLLETQKDLGL